MRFIPIPFSRATTFALILPLLASNLTTSWAQSRFDPEPATSEQNSAPRADVQAEAVFQGVDPGSMQAIIKNDKTLLGDKPLLNEPPSASISQAHAAQLRLDLEKAKSDLAKTKELIGKIFNENKQLAESRQLPPLEDAEVRVFQLKNTKADAAAEKVELLFGSQPLRIAVDEASNGLIVFGKAEAIPQVEQLIIKLDELAVAAPGGFAPAFINRDVASAQPVAPRRTLMLRVFWLANGVDGLDSADGSGYLPAPVLDSLAKLGLGDPRVVTQTVNSLAVEEGGAPVEFSMNVPAILFEQPVTLTSAGTMGATTDNRANVDMQLTVGGAGVNCELKGSLATPMGHFMVLGTANSVIPEQQATDPTAAEGGRGGMPTGYGERGGEMGRGGAMRELPAAKYNASRFAFVVQVIEAESFERSGD